MRVALAKELGGIGSVGWVSGQIRHLRRDRR
jgi:hypothetical protein